MGAVHAGNPLILLAHAVCLEGQGGMVLDAGAARVNGADAQQQGGALAALHLNRWAADL
jgi:hypothetical protein